MEDLDTSVIEGDKISQKILESARREGGSVSRERVIREIREEGVYDGAKPDLAEVDVDVRTDKLEEEGYLQVQGQRARRNQTYVLTENGRKVFDRWSGLEPTVENGYQEITRLLESGDEKGAEEFLTENFEDGSTQYEILSEVYENRTGEEL